MQEEFQEETIDLRDYYRVLMKRRWVIASLFLIVLLVVAVHTFTATPIYQAGSRIVIEKENPNVVSIQEVMAVDATGSDYYQTQYKIIESRSVARAVIERLNLSQSEEFNPKPKDDIVSNVKSWIGETIGGIKESVLSLLKADSRNTMLEKIQAEQEPDAELVNAFLSRITVEPIRNSRLVDISFEASDPILASKVANEIVRVYIDHNLETKLAAAKDAVAWLAERIEDERKKVEAAENALLAYKEEHQIITNFSSDAEQITAEKLAKLNQQVVEAEAARVETETRYQQALEMSKQGNRIDSIPEVLQNDVIKEIKKMEVDLYNRMSEMSQKYGKNHPKMIALVSELEDLQKRKEVEARQVVSSLRNQYKLAVAREQSLKRALAKQKEESLELNKKAIQYNVLQRQAESSQQMYDLLIKRFKETSLTEEMKTGNIRIVDNAEVPRFPIKPKKKLNLLLAAVVGLFLGVGFAFLLEYLDNTVKLPDDVKDRFKIPYLGPVPAFSTQSDNGYNGDLVMIHSPKASASESFRGIRTGIVFSSADKPPQAILVTSAGPGEGKTVCAANLAITMSQSGSKVLLIDCDMRKPRVHKVFDMQRATGISSVLVGKDALENAIVQTNVENLDILPVGPLPPNPAEIVGSRHMKRLVDSLRGHYERIIIDSPPVTAVTDAQVLAQLVDGVIVVIRAGATPKPIVENGLNQLKTVNAHILGAVLNGVKMGRDSYYYYQYYYYYYGEDGDRKKKTGRHKKHKGQYA